MCPTVATVHDVRGPVADVGASSNRVCATCPIVATGEVRPLLLGHHSSDGTVAVGRLPIATEGYGPLLQRCIVVVITRELFHVGWAQMVKYAQYMFILQLEANYIVAAQRTHLNENERVAIAADLAIDRLGRENHAFCQEMTYVLDKVQELQSMYHRLSEVEQELSQTHAQLQEAREDLETRTHAIVHLERTVE
jgi:hypothetical protein